VYRSVDDFSVFYWAGWQQTMDEIAYIMVNVTVTKIALDIPGATCSFYYSIQVWDRSF